MWSSQECQGLYSWKSGNICPASSMRGFWGGGAGSNHGSSPWHSLQRVLRASERAPHLVITNPMRSGSSWVLSLKCCMLFTLDSSELAVVNVKSRFIILFIFKANIFWQACVWLVIRADSERINVMELRPTLLTFEEEFPFLTHILHYWWAQTRQLRVEIEASSLMRTDGKRGNAHWE